VRGRRPSRSSLALRWLSIAVFLAIALAYVRPVRAYLHGRESVADRKADVAALAAKKRGLERRLRLAGNPQFVIREARRLGLVKPGETLYIVKGISRWEKARRGKLR
jgi:cell division protein FtsB